MEPKAEEMVDNAIRAKDRMDNALARLSLETYFLKAMEEAA